MRNRVLMALVMVFFYVAWSSVVAKELEKRYPPSKVVYDVTSERLAELENILDRISMLQNIYESHPFDASVVVVLHGSVISLFAKQPKDTGQLSSVEKLIERAQSLTVGDIIQFRLCRASAKMQGYNEGDFREFVAVVPMADAELVLLQQQGYAYIR